MIYNTTLGCRDWCGVEEGKPEKKKSRMMDWGHDALHLGLWYLEGLRVVPFGMALVDTKYSAKKNNMANSVCLKIQRSGRNNHAQLQEYVYQSYGHISQYQTELNFVQFTKIQASTS